ISLLALPPLLERDPTCIWEKDMLSLPDSANKKSIVLESYYSDLSMAVMGRPQATQQIDHVSLILSKFPKKKIVLQGKNIVPCCN
ncbi:unnamed protein product, partial [Brassica oleracea var. botrytis]